MIAQGATRPRPIIGTISWKANGDGHSEIEDESKAQDRLLLPRVRDALPEMAENARKDPRMCRAKALAGRRDRDGPAREKTLPGNYMIAAPWCHNGGMCRIFYIKNKLDNDQYLCGVEGKPITFTSADLAERYCFKMAVGLSLAPDTFTSTAEPPSDVAADVA